MQIMQRLMRDDAGFVVSMELVLVATILVIGVVVGLDTARNSVTNELADVSRAIDNLNQSLVVEGVQGHGAAVSGWQFTDQFDYCQQWGEDPTGEAPSCIRHVDVTGEGAAQQTQPSL